MSFRTRLTSFFVLIVVIPMIAVGFLIFRLISDSQQGKAAARANGVATAASTLYESEVLAARSDARAVVRELALSRGSAQTTAAALASQSGLARVQAVLGSRTVADVGSRSAVAPGVAIADLGRHRKLTVTVSELTAGEYVRDLAGPGVAIAVRQRGHTLSSFPARLGRTSLPRSGSVTLNGRGYRANTLRLPGFGGPVSVTVLSGLAAVGTGSVTSSRFLAAAFIVIVLLLALAFSVLASRGLQGQLSRFLQAARRLAGGDFSSPIKTEGHDEFAALGEEFNNMSTQLERRLVELSEERAKLRGAVQRIGQTFASSLDRPGLLELAMKTAIDAVQAEGGRLRVPQGDSQALVDLAQEGSLEGLDDQLAEAETAALTTGDLSETTAGHSTVLSVPLGAPQSPAPGHGLITVVRRDGGFSEDDRAVLRSLASQAALALENVDLHFQVSRQAVTDELTGLSNHRRFQELLALEMEQVRRYHHPVGLIMLDIDNFKGVNDTYGHQQGDVVLRRVARVLAETSREADFPARYGGEELALILPHTDMAGAFAIAERIRMAVEALRIPRVDDEGMLRVTASLGVADSTDGSKEELIRESDAALYEAKRQGKNRTIKAPLPAANMAGAG